MLYHRLQTFPRKGEKEVKYTYKRNKKKRMPIFYYAFHSKPQATDKLHIIVHSYTRNPRGPVNQKQQPDSSADDYGLIVESECGLKGILLKPDKDAYREGDFEGMGLKHFREKFSDVDVVYFFMPPVLRVSMLKAIAEEGIIPENKVCEICKDDLQVNVREATSELQEESKREGGMGRRKVDGNSLDLSKEGTSCLYQASIPANITDIALVNTSGETLDFDEQGGYSVTVSAHATISRQEEEDMSHQ
jgi:hypothetical protein